VDLDRLLTLASSARLGGGEDTATPPLLPLGQRIAVARDEAFAFAYPAVLEGWRRAGAEVAPFSPLGDEGPDAAADAVFLPGGYPELHAGRLAGNGRFLAGLRAAAGRGAFVYGECGGYMTLGERLVDREGRAHAMAGLLPAATSFEVPRRHLGYREMTVSTDTPLGTTGTRFRGHEFHYASEVGRRGTALFEACGADGETLGAQGCVAGTVAGSFLHLVDRR
jgi:cobyrinic acid a,c-diamide synthase